MFKVVGDELLSCVIMVCDIKIHSLLLLFLLSSSINKSIVIILMSNMMFWMNFVMSKS